MTATQKSNKKAAANSQLSMVKSDAVLVQPESQTTSGGQKARTEALQARMAAHPFLSGLSTEHLSVLALYAMETEFAKGDVVFREGDIANRFYLLDQGKVVLKLRVKGRPPLVLQTVEAGGVLGWSWLFPPFAWHSDAEAIEPVKAIFFYGTRLREHCEEDPRFGHELMQRVAELAVARVNLLQKTVVELSLRD